MALKPAMTSGQSKVTSFYRHHTEPRVHLYVATEETFPIPLKCIDVTRTTHTSLDVLQDKRISDYWNVDMDRTLSDSWTGFKKFTLLNEKPPPGYIWSGEDRLPKIQATTRPGYPGLRFGPTCRTQLRKRRCRNGLLKNQRSMMLEG